MLQIHGASGIGVHLQIVLPLCLPGATIATLMMFNLCMGAFTSAASALDPLRELEREHRNYDYPNGGAAAAARST